MNIENPDNNQPAQQVGGSAQQPANQPAAAHAAPPAHGQVAQPVIGQYAQPGQQGPAGQREQAGQQWQPGQQPGSGARYGVQAGGAAPVNGAAQKPGAPRLEIPTNKHARKAFLVTGILGLVFALSNLGTVLFGLISFFTFNPYLDIGFVERAFSFFGSVLNGFIPAAVFLTGAALIYAFAKRDDEQENSAAGK